MRIFVRLFFLLLPLAAAAAACAGPGGVAAAEDPGGELVVTRGELTERLLLTGELVAARAERLVVPRSPSFRVQVQWLAEDGARVSAGDEVVELDNSQFASELEDKKLSAAEIEQEVEKLLAEAAAEEAEKRFAVEDSRAKLDKARIAAAVPEDLLPRREHQERQLAVIEAATALAKAEEDLESARQAKARQIAIRRIDLQKARREIATAEAAIRSLSLTAPVDGVLVMERHPWEERKLQVGDTVFVGMTVAQIPDLTSLVVEAVLSDVDDGRVAVGMPAVSTVDAFPDQPLPGRVQEVAPMAREIEGSSQLRAFSVRVSLEGADAERLRPGMSVKVEVVTDHLPETLRIPRAAIDWSTGAARARPAAGGVVELSLGPCNPLHCALTGGLAEGVRLLPAAAVRTAHLAEEQG